MSQLTPIKAPFSAEIGNILEAYPTMDGYLLQLFRVFGNSARFLTKGILNLLDKDSPLTLRQREIVILRVTANNHCEYEWGVHVTAFAKQAGLSEAQIRASYLSDHTSACWNQEERSLIQAIDELCESGRISTKSYQGFSSLFDVKQQLEIFALCGNYHTVSFVANTSGLDNEPFAAIFPKS